MGPTRRPRRAGQQYQDRLRAQHRKLNPRTRWAKPRAGDGDGAALLEAGNVLGRPSRLPAGSLEVRAAHRAPFNFHLGHAPLQVPASDTLRGFCRTGACDGQRLQITQQGASIDHRPSGQRKSQCDKCSRIGNR